MEGCPGCDVPNGIEWPKVRFIIGIITYLIIFILYAQREAQIKNPCGKGMIINHCTEGSKFHTGN